MNVGYIGLGALGGSLARRFLQSHRLTVWDLNGNAVSALGAEGAVTAGTAAEVARASEVVVLCLPRSSDVRQALFGPAGLAGELAPGTLVIDQTSGVPSETREMAEALARQGCPMVDAAVSASPQSALQGEATLMVSGADEAVDRAMPILRGVARTVHRCGSRVGDGQATKMVNNAINGTTRLATLEIAALGRKLGLPLPLITDTLNAGRGGNNISERMLPAIAEGRESTNFSMALMLKDMNQAVSLGLGLGVPMPLCNAARALFLISLNTLGDKARLEDAIGLVEGMAGNRLAGKPEAVPADADRLASVIDVALEAVNVSTTYECLTVAIRYGLDLGQIVGVLSESSGWSKASRRFLPDLAAGRSPAEPSVGEVTTSLGEAARLAIEHGAPTVILGAARSLYEAATLAAPESGFTGFYESMTGVSLRQG